MRLFKTQFFLSLLLITTSVFAEEEAAPPADGPPAFFRLDPQIVTNYLKTGKKSGYLSVQVQIMAKNDKDIERVEHHEPLIVDRIIEVINETPAETIKTIEGKEALRMKAFERINEELEAEEGKPIATAILFTHYMWQ